MKKIDISTPKYPNAFTMVDDEDFEELSKYNWYANKSRMTFYASRTAPVGVSPRHVKMHREIMNPPEGAVVDHKNHNGLDNKKANLRICTVKQNNQHRQSNRNSKTGYKGVIWRKQQGKWRVMICRNRHTFHLGHTICQFKALKMYDIAATKLFGEFALLNLPVDPTCNCVVETNEYKKKLSVYV